MPTFCSTNYLAKFYLWSSQKYPFFKQWQNSLSAVSHGWKACSYQVIKDSICPPIPFDLASAAIQLQGACVCVCVCVCVSSTLKTYCQLCLNCEFPLILFAVLPDEILAKKHNYKPARVCVRVLGENNMSIRNESHIVPVWAEIMLSYWHTKHHLWKMCDCKWCAVERLGVRFMHACTCLWDFLALHVIFWIVS